jgi:hypothetical protein
MVLVVVVPPVFGVKGGKLVWDGQEWVWEPNHENSPIIMERGTEPDIVVVDEPDYLEITRDIARGW